MTNYEQQAKEFLNRWGIELKVKATNSGKCPKWFEDPKHIHGEEYRVRLSRPLTGKKCAFLFWNSFNDLQEGKAPTAYDILSCISSDIHCPDTFEEFCSEYGDNPDSRKALSLFRRCHAHGKKLRAFFDDEEMRNQLSEIQ